MQKQPRIEISLARTQERAAADTLLALGQAKECTAPSALGAAAGTLGAAANTGAHCGGRRSAPRQARCRC